MPSRRNLVVTDLSWFIGDTQNRFPNRVADVALYISGPNDVTFAPLQVAPALFDANSRGGVSVTNVTGFVVGPGAVVCANPSTGFTHDFRVIFQIIIHGFLAP